MTLHEPRGQDTALPVVDDLAERYLQLIADHDQVEIVHPPIDVNAFA